MKTYTLIARYGDSNKFKTKLLTSLSFESALIEFDEHAAKKSTLWVKLLSDENGETRMTFNRFGKILP